MNRVMLLLIIIKQRFIGKMGVENSGEKAVLLLQVMVLPSTRDIECCKVLPLTCLL